MSTNISIIYIVCVYVMVYTFIMIISDLYMEHII